MNIYLNFNLKLDLFFVRLFTTFVFLFFSLKIFSQDIYTSEYRSSTDPKRFYNEIESFLNEEAFVKSDKKLIIFSGSSSIRFWIGLKNDFSSYDILNRGFGGSIFSDLNFFIDDLVIKHNPDLIVIYEGDNDIAFQIPINKIFEEFKNSHIKIRSKLEKTPIIYIAAKPSPSRWNYKENYIELNKMIENYCENKNDTYFFDSWSIMLDNNGNIPKGYFWKDMLHMNRSGYEVWKKNLQPLINKILN